MHRGGVFCFLPPWPENIGRKSTAGYAEFHQMNDLAAELAVMPATARLNLKASK